MIRDSDKMYLERAVALAETALENGDAPFGSVLVSDNGDVLFEDCNKISSGDATRHPEFEIARWAAEHLSENERKRSTVYTSGEHCSMCASAHALVGLGRIVYASSSKQLKQWKSELGSSHSSLKGLCIEDVIEGAEVDGPDETLSKKVYELHVKYHQKH